jgi:hypothetical protein
MVKSLPDVFHEAGRDYTAAYRTKNAIVYLRSEMAGVSQLYFIWAIEIVSHEETRGKLLGSDQRLDRAISLANQ